MGIIAINNLYMNKMPNSCKECPLTYIDTGDDAYFGSNQRRCVIDDFCVNGIVNKRAYDCPLVEAIPKSDYENHLNADLKAILVELQLKIEEMSGLVTEIHGEEWNEVNMIHSQDILNFIQQKIDKLKERNVKNESY